METYDFSGWATRVNMRCSDGRTIMKDAFKHNDGKIVPIVWNHNHDTIHAVLGNAKLEHRDEGVYAYCSFNDTEAGKTARDVVKHGDVVALSIMANQLKQKSGFVSHGNIRELSLVLAGANPGAHIEHVLMHGDEFDEDCAQIYHDFDEGIEIRHADTGDKEDEKVAEEAKKTEDQGKTVQDIIDSMSPEQKDAMYYVVGKALDSKNDEGDDEVKHNDDDYEEGDDAVMKHNVFEKEAKTKKNVLSHADQAEILALAKTSAVGSLKAAMEIYAEDHRDTLAHGFVDEEGEEAISLLFPDYKDVHPGAPELIERDQSWVAGVMRKAHKSPISRIRTRQADARSQALRAKGYNDRTQEKQISGDIKLIMRTTDPQTVYRRDEIHRDDVIDITDFDVVSYIKTVMRHNLEEDIALAALVGDGREDTDPDKIHENHIRSIWHDDELYTIHHDVDIEAMRTKLQGYDTSVHFGEEYIYAEAIISAALYSRENYKGKGQLDLYCTPHMLNIMLLARDLNGRRIYDSKADLAKALNVGEIHTVEQFEGLTRTTTGGETKKLLGLFVNMANYQFGSTKGGEITNFEDFDIDFNMHKYLMETRLSGALTEIYSAIALEEPVAAEEQVAG